MNIMSRKIKTTLNRLEMMIKIIQIPNIRLKTLLGVVLVCALTNLLTYHLAYNRGREEDKTENPYPLIDFSRNFIPQEDFIVNLQPLRERLAPIYEEYGEEKISLYIEFVNSGANISYNPDARYYPASLIKMPVAIAAAKKVERGEWAWDSELVLFPEDVDSRSGKIGNNPIGSRFTIEELMRELLVVSDNTAYNMLLRNVGAGAVNDYLTDTGLEGLFDRQLNITAKEYTRLFRSLFTSSYLTREYSQRILQWLSESKDIYLDLGLPEEAVFAHKFGENVEEHIFADSGIVYIPNRPYIITVLFKGDGTETKSHVDSFFEKVSRVSYEFFEDQ